MTRHLSPSDVRRRAARKAERQELQASGLLPQQPNTFRYFENRLHPHRSIFESPTAQQDLNEAICCYPYDVAATEHSGGRLSVITKSADELAAHLISNGWQRTA